MLEVFIAILLALGSPVSSSTTTNDSGVQTTTQGDVGGEGGHIRP